MRAIFLLAFFFAAIFSFKAEAAQPWQVRWDETLRAAEKEGQVTVYASHSVGDLESIWAAFRKKFPRIKLNAVAISTTSDMVTKAMAERRAGQFLIDVVLGAPGATYNSFFKGNTLDPIPQTFILPEVADVSQWWKGKHHYVDAEGRYIFVYQSTLYGPRIQYNTQLIGKNEIKSVWNLLEPKWKGRIAALWPRANYVSTALLLMYHHPQIGPKFIENFYGSMEPTLFSDFRQGTDWLATGKLPLCFLCRLRTAPEQGLPVAEISPYDLKERPGIGAGNGTIALMKSHPHPNGAAVFINWYLSREGQIAFRQANTGTDDEGVTSMREDLPLEIVPELARRRKDVDYLEVVRADWMDWSPVRVVLEKATAGKNK
jgi:iron(III) transport system substrate-binding protein